MNQKCPLIKKQCIESACTFWTHMLGMHPQTGNPVDQWGCAVTWLPLLLVENSRHARGVQAAVESARNEITQRQDVLNSAVRPATQRAPIEDVKHEQLRDH